MPDSTCSTAPLCDAAGPRDLNISLSPAASAKLHPASFSVEELLASADMPGASQQPQRLQSGGLPPFPGMGGAGWPAGGDGGSQHGGRENGGTKPPGLSLGFAAFGLGGSMWGTAAGGLGDGGGAAVTGWGAEHAPSAGGSRHGVDAQDALARLWE